MNDVRKCVKAVAVYCLCSGKLKLDTEGVEIGHGEEVR